VPQYAKRHFEMRIRCENRKTSTNAKQLKALSLRSWQGTASSDVDADRYTQESGVGREYLHLAFARVA